MGRKSNEDLIHNLAENSSGDEGEPVASVDGNQDAEQEITRQHTLSNRFQDDTSTAAPPSPDQPTSVHKGGFLEPLRTKRQIMKWHPAAERKLLLFGLNRSIKPHEYQTIADSYNVGASGKSIGVHLSILRKNQRKALEERKINKDDSTIPGPAENVEAAQDERAAASPAPWDVRADRDLLLFGLGRERAHRSEHGRMAGYLPRRPTRQALRQRVEELYQESRQLLARYGLEEPQAENPVSRRRPRADDVEGALAEAGRNVRPKLEEPAPESEMQAGVETGAEAEGEVRAACEEQSEAQGGEEGEEMVPGEQEHERCQPQ